MPVAPILDASTLRRAIETYRDALALHRSAINRLNVYPVPDGDTGTNMALTLESVADELASAGPEMAAVCGAIAHGSLMGARGNSGVILSQILRGLTEHIEDRDVVDATALADALVAAADAAYGAVMRPVEGTILTVMRDAAVAARASAAASGSVLAVVDAARCAASDSLARTPELLAVLKDAGVVDAGGAGLLLLFDSLLYVLDGRSVPEPIDGGPVAAAYGAGPDHSEGALRGDVSARPRRRFDRVVQVVVGRARRFDRRRRRQGSVELSHPHRRHRCVDRSGDRGRRPSFQDPGHRSARAGRRARLGARSGWRGSYRPAPRAGVDRRRRRRCRRGHRTDLPLARRARHRDRRPIDEPVDRRPARRGGPCTGRLGGHPAQQQEHRPRRRSRRRSLRPTRSRWCRRAPYPRGSPRWSPTTPKHRSRRTSSRCAARPSTWLRAK